MMGMLWCGGGIEAVGVVSRWREKWTAARARLGGGGICHLTACPTYLGLFQHHTRRRPPPPEPTASALPPPFRHHVGECYFEPAGPFEYVVVPRRRAHRPWSRGPGRLPKLTDCRPGVQVQQEGQEEEGQGQWRASCPGRAEGPRGTPSPSTGAVASSLASSIALVFSLLVFPLAPSLGAGETWTGQTDR
jgi:hypothetical protein